MEKPLVALLSSTGADSRVNSRGFPSVAHLLSPFTTHQINIRDPSNAQYVSSKISIDIRDVKRQGHLLSLSVLPYVLREALLANSNLGTCISAFQECLHRWAEPVDQETLRTHLACIFVIAGCEENPLGELSRLIQLQHTQQHSTTEVKALGPSHCSPPKWTTPNTLKHYILLHDSARDDDVKSSEVFNQMCSTYGVDACQMLRIGIGAADGLPDAWKTAEENDRLLFRGLSVALQHATGNVSEEKNGAGVSASSISTISPSYAMIKSPSVSSSPLLYGNSAASSPLGARLASSADRVALEKAVENFVKNSLVPHVERQLRTWIDQISDRRGIGKSLTTGMKKWFGSTTVQTGSSGPISYSPESNEMKCRRLADIAFQFGLYSFAHSQYRALKKDFETEQAWIHHATALEMCAVALHLSDAGLSAKQFPTYYLENALNLLLSNSAKYTSVMRCALNGSRILSELGQFKEAALLLSHVATLDNDVCVGVAQAQAAAYFEKADLLRKASFYRVLAGKRLTKGGVQSLALECYRLALLEYYSKQWDSIEDHLCFLISVDISDQQLSIDCASRLVRECEWQSADNQQTYMDNFIRTLARFRNESEDSPVRLPVPLVDMQKTCVICGDRPLANDIPNDSDIDWHDMERAAFHVLAGTSHGFRPIRLISDDTTDNGEVRETPPGERFRLRVVVRNPLIIPLTIHNVRLDAKDVKYRVESSELAFPFCERIGQVQLAPEETKHLELWLQPGEHVSEFRVDSVLLDLIDSSGIVITGRIPLTVRGKRLNKNAKQMKQVTIGNDERLHARVAARQWPLLDLQVVRPAPDVVYCSQAVKLGVEAKNIGYETIDSLCVSTDAADSLYVDVETESGSCVSCSSSTGCTTNEVRVHKVDCSLPIGSQLKLNVTIRAPSSPGSSTVSLLFYYRGQSGAYREWRTVVVLNAIPLLQATASVLNESRGLFMIETSNLMSASAAALSRIEILRINSTRQILSSSGEWISSESQVEIHSVVDRNVQLECEQSDNICLTARRDLTMPSSKPLWICEPMPVPAWAAPRPVQENDLAMKENMQLALLWKASVVDNFGHVSTLLGELFIPWPFQSTTTTSHLADDVISSSNPIMWKESPVQNERSGLIRVHCEQVDPVFHDFARERVCEFPLHVRVDNQDGLNRLAAVSLRFLPKVRDAVGSVQQVPPDARQLWWPDRVASSVVIQAKKQHVFSFNIRVGQPSVYEFGGSQMIVEGTFDGEPPIVIKIPSALVVVHAL